MAKSKLDPLSGKLSELVKRFSKDDVIAEMEKEYQSVAAKNIPLIEIDDNSFIKRIPVREEDIERITPSVTEKGLYNPLVVRPSGSHYELILGRKRYYAAKRSHLVEVPAVIKDFGDEETLLMLLADTRDQRNGNVVEMALIYQVLCERFSYSQKTLAELSHQSRSQVTNILRLLQLPDPVVKEISQGTLTYGHAKAIASLSDDEIERIIALIHERHLSVRETENMAKQYSAIPQAFPSKMEELKTLTHAESVLIKKTSVSFLFAKEEEKDAFLASLRSNDEKISK
jgi:ParB family chromosome partitioning protein